MINMMYLVLTALLALNVSKEILDSFVTVNNGLETTKGTLKEKVDGTYKTFAQYASENKEKYGAAYTQAAELQKMAAEVIKEIDGIKAEIIVQTEGVKIDKVYANDTILNLRYVNSKDNQEAITHVMIGSDETKPKEGEHSAVDLKKKLEAFKDKIKAMANKEPKNPTLSANMDKMFNFEKEKEAGSTGAEVSWEVKNFYHVPMAAGITILSKIQTDVRNAENEAVNYMLGNVEQKSFKFNTLAAIVKPQSSYVTVGSKYVAEIFLGAYDNQNIPDVFICGPGAYVDTTSKPPKIVGESTKLPMNGAKALLEQVAGGAGLRKVSGLIKFKPVGGEDQYQPFETEYEVAAPNLVVSPTKMNVFYRGVDNPVDISVAGYSAKDIQPSMSNGSLSKAAQGFIVKPGKDPKATIGVTVTNPDGSKKSLPGLEFRVKNVPDPKPYFGGKSLADQTIKKTELTAAAGVLAKMVDFEFDLKFEVIEYTVSANLSGNFVSETVKGAGVNGTVSQMFGKIKTGQKVFIENIKARGPDGSLRPIGTLSLKVI
ncbi:MAG: gliding motility protein GldM [Flavobacteriales bacterium]|nr:gliding motility protein GldM [Flavobacteriales bacterium]